MSLTSSYLEFVSRKVDWSHNRANITMAPEKRTHIGRRLVATAVLWQDWDQEVEDIEPGYWELFTDLLMVAAASSIADNFKEQQNWQGFLEFAILYAIMVNGWLLYSHHYTCRFEETSLLHSFILLFFLLGMAASIVNAGYDTARGFSLAVILQLVAFLCMIVPTGIFLPRARAFCTAISCATTAAILCFVVTAVRPDWAPIAWGLAAFWMHFTEFFMIFLVKGDKLIPANIEHSKDRLGVLVLVMLGETVISSTMTYREFAADSNVQEDSRYEYYVVLTLSFLLIFMFTLLFFNLQPASKDHAYRRSRGFGSTLLILNKTLGLSLLAIGVSIKLIVEAVAEREDMSSVGCRLLGLAVGSSMTILFGMRLCHYGGKLPRASDPIIIQRLMWIWWSFFGVASIIPFLFLRLTNPIVALALYSGLLMTLCIVESLFTTILQDFMPGNEETAPLLNDRISYDTVSNAVDTNYPKAY
jgi:low temperature requirement protein LtrA